MQDRKTHFERAINERSIGPLGDPERWGGVGELAYPRVILGHGGSSPDVYTPQIIRVQCSDLLARSWDLIVNWDIQGLDPSDVIVRCSFELTIGVGQASRRMFLNLTAALSGYPSNGFAPPGGNGQMPPIAWEATPDPSSTGYSVGTVSLSWPIPAAALAGRFVLNVLPGIVGPAAPTITATCFAAVSPRALA